MSDGKIEAEEIVYDGNMPGHVFDLQTDFCIFCGLPREGLAQFPQLRVCGKQMEQDAAPPLPGTRRERT